MDGKTILSGLSDDFWYNAITNIIYVTICSLIKAALDSSSFELTEEMPGRKKLVEAIKKDLAKAKEIKDLFEKLEIERRSAGL